MTRVYSPDIAPPSRKLFPNRAILADFLGMHFHRWPVNTSGAVSNAPTIPYSIVRSHDSQAGNFWSNINTALNTYDWTTLDAWYNRHVADGKEMLYTVMNTPTWASARPAEARSPYGILGASAEPANMAHLVLFVQALVSRYPLINYLEVWNEPVFPVPGSGLTFFTGTGAKLAEMVRVVNQAAKAIRPGIKILNPPPSNANVDTKIITIMESSAQGYNLGFGDGAGTQCKNWVDVIAFHTYQNPLEYGINMGAQLSALFEYFASIGINHLPKWSTEIGNIAESYGGDVDMVRKLARLLICSMAAGCDKVFWYAWDNDTNGDGTPLTTDATGVSTRLGAAALLGNFLDQVRGRTIYNVVLLQSQQIRIEFAEGDIVII